MCYANNTCIAYIYNACSDRAQRLESEDKAVTSWLEDSTCSHTIYRSVVRVDWRGPNFGENG